MAATADKRDYSLTGPEGKRAEEKGLVAADWYQTPHPAGADEGAHEAQERTGDTGYDHLVRGG
ncbi:hypothetical protein OMP38_13890 [Cohnella ginsengisoli]|uniref:Uncharacterized protein n=1 Tax=Cohnella ginsengisoli TaxID=425004 RepID=A0A9X4KH14_9BACL|nr:hypothetical protein [Cohnella ginsengisoli]MDG0791830.1 hypothetical protein [Cohnella ginsengisoli]